MTARRYLTPTQKGALWKRQNKCCADCNEPTARPEFDHQNPLWNTGNNLEPNWQALCNSCHTAKTRRESGERAKTYRLEQDRLGIKKKRRGQRLQSAPFQTRLRKRMDGTVEVRT